MHAERGDAVRRRPNIFHGAKQYSDDYSYDPVKLKEELEEDYYLVRSYFFDSYKPDSDDKDNFFYALDMNGYRVIDVPLRERGDGYIEKGVDIRLTTEFIAHAYNDSYQTLATGDDDYVRAAEHVQDAGKRVVIATWDNNIGRRMKRVCDEYVEWTKSPTLSSILTDAGVECPVPRHQ